MVIHKSKYNVVFIYFELQMCVFVKVHQLERYNETIQRALLTEIKKKFTL